MLVSIGSIKAQNTIFGTDDGISVAFSKVAAGTITNPHPTTTPPSYNSAYFAAPVAAAGITPCTINPGDLDFSNMLASDVLALYPTAGITYTQQTIKIDGIFVIDTNIFFDDCQIEFGPFSRIVFAAGLTTNTHLKFEESDLYACGNTMWDGIMAYDVNHELTIGRLCTVRDAISPVFATNCADYNIVGNAFSANVYDLIAGDCNTDFVGQVEFNTFDKTACLFPFLTLGDNGVCLYMRNMGHEIVRENKIKNYNYGVYLQNTDATLELNSIIQNSNIGLSALMMYCRSESNSLYSSNNSYQGYEFGLSNIDRSVVWAGVLFEALSPFRTFFEIDNDNFNNFSNTAVEMRNRIAGNSFVKNSDFTSVDFGIKIEDASVTPPAPPTFSDPGKRITVEGNNFNNLLGTGIQLTNIHGSYVYGAPGSIPKIPKIKGNVINLATFTVGSELRGIRVNNGFRTNITENIISSSSTISPPFYRFIKGISTSDSKQSYIADNTLYRLGDGFHIIGNNKLSQWECNAMNYCYRGMNFDDGSEYGGGSSGFISTIITDQGAYNDPTDNWWFGTPVTNDRVIGSLNLLPFGGNQIKWYYRNTASNYFPAMSIFTGNSFNRIGVPDIFEQCNGTMPEALVGDFEEMVDGSMEYNVLEESFEYKDNDFVYRQMSANEALSGQSLVLDNFFDLMENSGIETNLDIQRDMANNDLAAALEKNENWLTENLHESNRKTVNNIYLNSVAIGEAISAEDQLTLETIALTTPYLSGDAVYTARVLLGIDPTDYGISYRVAAANVSQIAINMYPNPSSGNLSIAFEKSSEDNCIFNCYDLSGKLLLSKKIPKHTQEVQMDLSLLSNGVYFIEIEENGIQLLQEKLILTK